MYPLLKDYSENLFLPGCLHTYVLISHISADIPCFVVQTKDQRCDFRLILSESGVHCASGLVSVGVVRIASRLLMAREGCSGGSCVFPAMCSLHRLCLWRGGLGFFLSATNDGFQACLMRLYSLSHCSRSVTRRRPQPNG